MKKNLIALLLGLVVLLTACPEPTPPANTATWDSSNWDSTTLWQ